MTASWLVYQFITSLFPVFSWYLSSVLSLTSPQSSLLWRHSSRYFARRLHSASYSCPRWVRPRKQKLKGPGLRLPWKPVVFSIVVFVFILYLRNIFAPRSFWWVRGTISNTKDCVGLHFQTQRRELKIRCVAEHFLAKFEVFGNMDKSLSWVFDISSQSKLKLRGKRRNEIVKTYAN